ncbi:MAG: DUF362 domain-containing protein [Synergistetes bacterium]|nr:DUF362 domain-containing protein [Synergistota bacterium]MCX8127559.1 DUF362 domain-containing protein [Synergistota bacterium]MDW8191524.1 DUF362 domain-containing protein [Synergistota bacterium]
MRIAIKRLSTITYDEIRDKVREIFDLLGGIEKFLSPKDKVLIKPNLLSPSKVEEARITDPRVIEAVVEIIHPIVSEVWIGDSSGVSTKSGTQKTMESINLHKIPEKFPKVKLRNFDEESRKPYEISLGKKGKMQITIAEAVFQADKIINLPKLKTHNLTVITCAVKNTFGCLPGSQKARVHAEAKDPESFAHALIDIHLAVKPILTIVDATISMEGEGPAWGKPKETKLLFGGENPFAVDIVASRIIGFIPTKIPTIKVAEERGLNPERIDILGERLEEISYSFEAPKSTLFARALPSFIWRGLTPKVKMDENKCVKCGICIKHCPVGAITFNPFPKVDHGRCILCFCCHELCPVGAVQIQERILSRIFLRGVV